MKIIDVHRFILLEKVLTVIAIVILLLMYSCRKDEVVHAKIVIQSPYEHSTWQYGDSIYCNVSLSSENNLKECKICIVNESMQIISKVKVFPLQQKEEHIQGYLDIDNKYIKTGSYYIFVQIWDVNGNYSNSYVKIYISELPLESIAVYIITQPTNNTIEVSTIDSSGMPKVILTAHSDYSGSAICSEHGYLYLCGRSTGPLAAYSLHKDNLLMWKIDAIQNPPFSYFESVDFDGRFVISGLTEHLVKGYTPQGMLNFVFETPEMFPKQFLRHRDVKQNRQFLIIGMSYFMGNATSISVYYNETYYNMQFLIVEWDCVRMFSKDSNEIYVFGNDNNRGFIKVYSIQYNNTYELKSLPGGQISDVVEIQNGTYLIAHESGLFFYQREYNSLTPYGAFDGGGILGYDYSKRICYYAIGNKMRYFSIFDQHITGEIEFLHSIRNIHILYNK
jgi:WD40 repeat protein